MLQASIRKLLWAAVWLSIVAALAAFSWGAAALLAAALCWGFGAGFSWRLAAWLWLAGLLTLARGGRRGKKSS